jgi:hypothetical protein
VLFIVLALGSLLNLSQPPYQPEAEHYHALARAALGAEEPLADSLTGVQALLLMCVYNRFNDEKDGPTRAWSLSGLAYKMSAAVSFSIAYPERGRLLSCERRPELTFSCLPRLLGVYAQIGLHRDGKLWNLTTEEADRRRTVFWEVRFPHTIVATETTGLMILSS